MNETTTQPTQAGPPPGYCGKVHETRFMGDTFTCNRTDKHEPRDCKWHRDRWSPPIAPPTPAPARACKAPDWCGFVYKKDTAGQKAWLANMVIHVGGYCSDACFDAAEHAPATSEPGRACGCKGLHDASQCPPEHATIGDCIEAQNKPHPAQEAAKAPVLPFSFTDNDGREHRFATANCRDNASRDYWSWMKQQSGTSAKELPEHLPRPRLTHSAMWADWAEDVS